MTRISISLLGVGLWSFLVLTSCGEGPGLSSYGCGEDISFVDSECFDGAVSLPIPEGWKKWTPDEVATVAVNDDQIPKDGEVFTSSDQAFRISLTFRIIREDSIQEFESQIMFLNMMKGLVEKGVIERKLGRVLKSEIGEINGHEALIMDYVFPVGKKIMRENLVLIKKVKWFFQFQLTYPDSFHKDCGNLADDIISQLRLMR